MNIIKRMLSSLLFILVSAWVILSVLIYVFQSHFIFFPHKNISYTPTDINLSYEDVYLNTPDGYRIHGWYIPHRQSQATLLFLHGNAGNISHRLESLRIFHELGLSVLIIDYRGYGNSEGSPSETGTYLDAESAWYYLTQELELASDKIIIFGRSLGGAVAIWLAHKQLPGALIIESTFTSVIEMGQHLYPYLPVKMLARIHYPSIDRVADINCPTLVIHSTDDEIIPFDFGRRLFEAAQHPKDFVEINGGHNDGFLLTLDKYIKSLNDFINEHIHSSSVKGRMPQPLQTGIISASL